MTTLTAKLTLFARDIKLSHTLFAMPFALFAVFLAARGMPSWGVVLLIIACMVSARTLAMGANRLLDARLDAANPRTAGRAIPAGRLTTTFYLAIILGCAVAFELATAGFWKLYDNPWPLVLSLPVLAFLAGYPLMKRFTRFCHYYLGLALGLAPLCAWVATAGRVAWEPVIMCASVLLWTAGFDILYACQDYQSDVQTGVVSIPAKLGIARALWLARLSHLVSWSLLVVLWWVSPVLSTIFAGGIVIAAILLVYEHSLVKAHDLSKLDLAFFTLNGIISAILGLSGIVNVLLTTHSADSYMSAIEATRRSIESQTSIWVSQHPGATPDFNKYPNWEQFISKTQPNGDPAADGPLGPYLHNAPRNPLNARSDIVQVDQPIAPGYRPPRVAGWVYSSTSQGFLATDTTATACADPAQCRARVPSDWEKLKSHYAQDDPITGTVNLVRHHSDDDPSWFLLIPATAGMAFLAAAFMLLRRVRLAIRRQRKRV